MGKVQNRLNEIASTGRGPTARDLAELGDAMLGGPKRRRKRSKERRFGVDSPNTKAKWKAGGKRQKVRVYTDEEKAEIAARLGLNSTA